MRLLDLKLNKRRWWHILFDVTVISPYLSHQSLCFDKCGCHKNLGRALKDRKDAKTKDSTRKTEEKLD
jgi:hypothetical protein